MTAHLVFRCKITTGAFTVRWQLDQQKDVECSTDKLDQFSSVLSGI